jgi:hypothetical protein
MATLQSTEKGVQSMANHITINRQTYSSVNQMPPDVRRQYEAAMQLLSNNTAAAAGDVNISTSGIAPTPHTFNTVTHMTASRIVVNGKEYARWEDVPAEARAAFQAAGVNPQMPFAPGAKRVAHAMQTGNAYQLSFSSSSRRISLSLTTVIILLIIILLLGLCIGFFLR